MTDFDVIMTSINEELGLLITDVQDRRTQEVPQGLGLQPDNFGFSMIFANAWGISVIRDYGLFEIMIIKQDSEEDTTNSISNDVLRGLSSLEVVEYAKRISSLNLNGFEGGSVEFSELMELEEVDVEAEPGFNEIGEIPDHELFVVPTSKLRANDWIQEVLNDGLFVVRRF